MLRRIGRELVIPALAIVSAFVITLPVVGSATGWDWGKVAITYGGLMDGAFFKPHAFTNTLVAATPLIFTGLALALGFRSGVFNIGASGQFLMGAVCGVYVAYAIPMPPILHPLASLVAGAIGGGLWGAIPGYLKARLGSHEVINTIMLNYVAFFLQDWLVKNPMKDPIPSVIRTPDILATAVLPRLLGPDDRLHVGFLLALLTALFIWWLLFKTTIGFELRTAGSNPDAAKYAGVNATRSLVLAMTLSGALAGIAGTVQVLGLDHNLPALFSSDFGFDAIPVALLGQNQPLGVVFSAILFGALRNGSDVMQIRSGGVVSKEVVFIVQAMVLLFAAVPALVRWLYRLRLGKTALEGASLTRGWG